MQGKHEKSTKIIDRLSKYVDNQGLSLNQIAQKIGVSNSYFSKMQKNNGSMGEDIINNILLYYDDISPDWLLTGRGEMLKNKLSSISQDITGKYNKQFANSNIISDINEIGYDDKNESIELKRENKLLKKQLDEKDALIKILIEQQEILINKLK